MFFKLRNRIKHLEIKVKYLEGEVERNYRDYWRILEILHALEDYLNIERYKPDCKDKYKMKDKNV